MARAPAAVEVDDLPEADRLEGFPHPRETELLLGHAAAEAALGEAFAGGRMHHAWLIAGRAGIGKATLAYRLARYALSRPEERDPSGRQLNLRAATSATRQIGARAHPGLLVLRRPYDPRAKRFAASIPVDEVRRLRTFLGLTAGENAWRIVIVDTADELNVSAGNALLKAVEEPPARAIFLLIASEPNRLLPTIRSRCRRLDLQPLQPAPLRQATETALAAAGVDKPTSEQWRVLERLADGSVRRALQLTGSGGLELYERIEGLVGALPALDWAAVHMLADQLSLAAQEQRFEAFLDLLLDLLARRVRVRALGSADAAERAAAERLIRVDQLGAWAALWEDIVRERADTAQLNLDKRSLILGTFARLEALARR